MCSGFSNILYMFTENHNKSPMYFSRLADVSGWWIDINRDKWPFNSLNPSNKPKDTALLGKEEQKQIKVLGPLTNTIAQKFNNWHSVEMIHLVQEKSKQVIHLANATEVTISGKKTTILQILADASMWPGSWSVVWHESIEALNGFVAQHLTLANLKNL